MKIEIKGWSKFGYLGDVLLQVENHRFNNEWGYITSNSRIATSLGFKEDEYYGYFLPIKDIAHTRGFYSTVFCVYKGYKCQFMSSTFNEENQTFCMRLSPDLALAKGYNWNQIGHEIQTMDVHLSDLDEIYRRREKLDDFIFDVDPIKPIYKDGKWLIEPDENGVYVI